MAALNCHSCGATSAPDPNVSFINCEYCGASISVAAFYKGLSSNSLESLAEAGLSEDEQRTVARLVDDSSAFMNAGDLAAAKDRLESVLKVYPGHIPSRLNLAKCLLKETAVDVKQRCETVLNYCEIVAEHQKDTEITSMIDGIAFDMASLATSSVNGFETLKLFELSTKISLKHDARDLLINTFVEPLFEKFKTKMNDGINEKKSSFSPSTTDIELLCEMSRYNYPAKGYCLTLAEWINDNSGNVHRRTLDKVSNIMDAAEGYSGDYQVFKVGFFGITQSTNSV
jgi:hypothetical protein